MVVHSAYMLINKAIPSTGGPYTVRFYDDNDDLIQTDTNVPQYGKAHCTLLDGSIVDGLYFKGWNPAPDFVTRDMDCHPLRGDYIINHEETHDTWETICADNGAHYPLGTYRSLIISVSNKDYADLFNSEDGLPTTGSNKPILYNDHKLAEDRYPIFYPGNYGTENEALISIECDMVKVAEGEDGTTSTWLSTGLARFGVDAAYHGYWLLSYKDAYNAVGYSPSGYMNLTPNYITDYSDSTLNYAADTMLYRVLPATLRAKIKSVDKTYKGVVNSTDAYSKTALDKTKLCKVWLPSRKELSTYETTKITLDSTVTYDPEFTGIDYSSIYMPSWETLLSSNKVFSLRSMVGFVGMNRQNKLGAIQCGSNTYTMLNKYTGDFDNTNCIYFPFGFCL